MPNRKCSYPRQGPVLANELHRTSQGVASPFDERLTQKNPRKNRVPGGQRTPFLRGGRGQPCASRTTCPAREIEADAGIHASVPALRGPQAGRSRPPCEPFHVVELFLRASGPAAAGEQEAGE